MRFIREYLLVPKGHGALKPVKLRDFQKEIVVGSHAPGIRTALVSIPRGNAKTTLAAMLGLAEMFVGPPSASVAVVASDHRQAKIMFNAAKRMVELNPELLERVQIYAESMYYPHNDATMTPLPAEYDALQGRDDTLTVIDELHVVTRPVWEAATSGAGKRPDSLTLAISTPGNSEDSVMWDLVKLGREGIEPSFYFKEYAAPENCRIDDEDAWMIANPAAACKDPFLAVDGIRSQLRTLREPSFRQLRLGQWAKGIDSWLPFGMFENLADLTRTVPHGSRVALGFDGSASGDSTALVACTLDPKPHLFVLGVWENPGSKEWRVPREEVGQAVDDAFETYDVVDMAADPWGWRSEMEQWGKRWGAKRVIEWDTSKSARMAPATDRLYQKIALQEITHDGHPALMTHFSNCVAVNTTAGVVVMKDKRMSPRKIDLAVASIAAVDRSQWHTNTTKKKRVLAW